MKRRGALRIVGLFFCVSAVVVAGCAGDDSAGSGGTDGGFGDGGSGGGDGGGPSSMTAGGSGFTSGSGGDTGGVGDDGGEPEPNDDGANEESSTGDPLCDDQTPVELFLSPDDSNSMSSPVQVRDAVLDDFSSLSSAPIRTWEFFNYYTFDYPEAASGELVVTPSLLHEEGAEDGTYVLQIGVSSEHVENAQRRPINLTLALDTSGSMAGHPIEMLRDSCRAIAASLRGGDIVSMVTWDTSNAVVLAGHEVSGPNDPALLAEINAIASGGGTDLHGGLTAGYEAALASFASDRINRIVLISDGGANVGITDEALIAEHAGANNEDGIYMVGVGVGTAGTYNDDLMDIVTDVGKGASIFINSEPEAWKIFNENFVNTISVAARDVQVQLDLPPGYEVVKFSGEDINTNPAKVEPQHIAPNDAMVFHQEIETCAPELVDDVSTLSITVRYMDALTFELRETSVTASFSDLAAQADAQLLKGAAVFQYAESLKDYKETEKQESLNPAFTALDRADQALPGDPDLAEIRSILSALQP